MFKKNTNNGKINIVPRTIKTKFVILQKNHIFSNNISF